MVPRRGHYVKALNLLKHTRSMNRLSGARRARIIGCLAEGMSIRAAPRLTGASQDTILKLLVALGPSIAPGASVVLRMRVLIPHPVPLGPDELLWGMDPGAPSDANSVVARASLTIVRGS